MKTEEVKNMLTVAPVLLYGPPGMGKTYLAREVLGDNCPTHWCMPSDSRPDAMGHWIIGETGTFVYHLGEVAKGMQEGRLIINEVNEASEELIVCLLWALDNQSMRAIVTMNGSPETLHPALASRLPFKIAVEEPTAGLVSAIHDCSARVAEGFGQGEESSRAVAEHLLAAITTKELDPRSALAILRALDLHGEEGWTLVEKVSPGISGALMIHLKGAVAIDEEAPQEFAENLQ